MSLFDHDFNRFKYGDSDSISVTQESIAVPVRETFGGSVTINPNEVLNGGMPPEQTKKIYRAKLMKGVNRKIADWLSDSPYNGLSNYTYSVTHKFGEDTNLYNDSYTISIFATLQVTEIQSVPIEPHLRYFNLKQITNMKEGG